MFLVSNLYSDETFLEGNVRAWLEYLEISRAPLPGSWYGWKKYVSPLTAYDVEWSPWRVPQKRKYPCSNVHDGCYPKMPALPGLAEAYKQIRDAGGYPSPYVCLQIYDQGRVEPSPYAAAARPNAARNVHGKTKIYGDEGGNPEPSWAMCVHTDWWRDRLAETVAELVREEHAGGIYLDTMHGSSRACFAVEHGHAHGGGDSRPIGMHELAEICRAAVKKADPNAYTDGEGPTEAMIDAIDGILYQYTLRPGLSEPVFAAVYQDYIPRYGMKCYLEDGEGFFIGAGSLFVEGAMIGRIRTCNNGDGTLLPSDPKHAEQIAFLKRLVGYYRREAAKKFLCYGRLLRPLSFTKPDPMPRTNYVEPGARTYLEGRIRIPCLQRGVFRAADGELGVFIVNIGAEPISYTATMPAAQYGLADDEEYDLHEIASDGKAGAKRRLAGGSIVLAGVLAGRDAIMYRLVPAEGR